ncbi:hypothetical protein [Massilia sp. 9096]|uniref:hypothetical protein n=1 Tax=Massilia sp. 9096 TaxID=1500894 RepID=UPI0018CCA50B|nr:hypothetical protein [Massilia sp. 9096]
MNLKTMTSDSVKLAKEVLLSNEAVRFGVFGIVATSGYFPPRQFLNEFLRAGTDPCDQDQRMPPWKPFSLSADDYLIVKAWWIARHSGAVESSLGATNWNDWAVVVIHDL